MKTYSEDQKDYDYECIDCGCEVHTYGCPLKQDVEYLDMEDMPASSRGGYVTTVHTPCPCCEGELELQE